jgi:hypothetical protein
VHKGSTQTNKYSKLGIKKKEAKETKGCPSLAHRTIRCTRTVQLRTLHLRVSEAALRYNSLDCPVYHRTDRCTKRSNGYQHNGRLQRYNARTVRAEVRAAARGAPDSEQYMSGAAPDCPVPLEDKALTVEP